MAPKAPSQTLEEPFKIFNRMATQSSQSQDIEMQQEGQESAQLADEDEELDEDRHAILMDVPLKPIQALDENVVNRIAAGEIIHRPANALKELIENSLDAGSTLIKITLKEGGLKTLQIQDNGCGVRPEDMPLLAQRFATSKLRDFSDLSSMTTFGFRGEALASISYVSASMRVVSKPKDATCAYSASYANGALVAPKAGQPSAPKPSAGSDGTLIMAEDLFYNMPQRRRALKSAAEEYNRCLDVAAKYAVHYGGRGVGFVCKKTSSNQADLSTASSPSTTTLDAIRALHGNTVAKELVRLKPLRNARLAFNVEGWISGANWSGKKTVFLCFINHRLVDCPSLKRSFEALYSALLPKGGHPWVYVSLEIEPEKVDVNVHPTKREVHFLDEDDIIEEVCAHAQELLAGANASRRYEFTQAILPGASEPDSAPKPKSRPSAAPQHMVRTDASTRTLLAMGFTQTAGPSRTAVGTSRAGLGANLPPPPELSDDDAEFVALKRAQAVTKITESDCDLTSVRELRAEVSKSRHAGLSDILRSHTFVGVVDESLGLSLIQHETRLYIVNHAAVIEELSYQLVLRQFGALKRVRLDPAPSVRELIRIGLEAEPDADQAKMKPEEIIERITRTLFARAEMLDEYFSIRINASTGLLESLPVILPSQEVLQVDRLPTLLLRLGPQVDWTDEKRCFETLAREVAYAHVPSDVGGHGAEVKKTVDVQHTWFASLRRLPILAPKKLLESDVVQVANLPDLYRVFERC